MLFGSGGLTTLVTGCSLLALLLLPGCGDHDAPKKVSLQKRSPPVAEVPTGEEDAGSDSLKFGFDHRLSPKEDVRIYFSLIQYLNRQTGYKFSLKFTESYEKTADNLGRGLLNFAALGPVNCVIAKNKYGAGCLVTGLNQEGRPAYRAVIFARADSTVTSLAELRGKSFAFGDRFSTQGHVIPRKMLEDAGVTLKDLRGYVYTGSHANTAKAVLSGDYEAGAIQDTLAESLSREGRIKIIAASAPYPSSLICYTKEIDPATLTAVKKALLAMEPQGAHRDLLPEWERTEMARGFVAFQSDSLRQIEELVDRYLASANSPVAGRPSP